MPPKPHGVYHSSRENFRKKSKSQKVFDFSNFSNCSNFSTFRLFEFFDFFDFSSRNLLACELFDFSTFRLFEGKNRDFHGVTDTSQKSTQPKLWGTPHFHQFFHMIFRIFNHFGVPPFMEAAISQYHGDIMGTVPPLQSASRSSPFGSCLVVWNMNFMFPYRE